MFGERDGVVALADVERVFHALIAAHHLRLDLRLLHGVDFARLGQALGHRHQIARLQILQILPLPAITAALFARRLLVIEHQEGMIGCGLDRARSHAHLEHLAFAFGRLSRHPGSDDGVLRFVERENGVPSLHLGDGFEAACRIDAGIAGQTLVLRAHPGQEFPLGLGDAQAVERLLDLAGHIVPVLTLLFGRLDVVVDVIEIDGAEVGAPGGGGAREEDIERLVAELAHPVRLVLHVRDLVDDLVIQPFLGLEGVFLRHRPAVFVIFFDARKRLTI